MTPLTARQVMRRPRLTALPHVRIADVFTVMQDNDIRHLPVVDESDRLLGMLDERAVLMSAFRDPRRPRAPLLFADATAAEVMHRSLRVATPQCRLSDLIPHIIDERLTCLPVVDHQHRLCGLMTRTDVLSALCAVPLPPENLEISA